MPLSGYELNEFTANMGAENTWTPTPQLNTTRLAGDISLIYLAPNNIKYTKPEKDPFFSTYLNASVLSVGGQNFSFYESDYYVHVMGCIDQHQFCNPNRLNGSDADNCTRLTGARPIENDLTMIGYNVQQLATANRIRRILVVSGGIGSSISGKGKSALRANQLVYSALGGSIQAPLPDNQWTIEVTYWFATRLAQLQRAIVEFAAGPANLPPEAQVITPTDNGWPIMCKQQRVHNPGGYQNFSTLSISLILGVGGIIIILSWIIEPFVDHWRRKQNLRNHKRLQWILDNKLQLQRMAYEYINLGRWDQKDKDIPVTMPMANERIFRLPGNIDPHNPGLSGLRDVFDQEDSSGSHHSAKPSRNPLSKRG
ncbi:hypothetical protein BJX68DRAFT_270781 [Aspergillus pseudodeflectus]|uniref:Uncharacterized protein n=1 Tax=Aspergillus pseudodeflectus TaxID=176178 RepID=A0ABR4JPV7_9EURO